ncbi:MerR family transcriptional regulator [Patescibacteria group bacterium]|nr:MerR family transcriptional regulator [Patescibacteria group bacterium]MCL5091288.1 MerR family transcriptional regulator [Patescibacteria group bacterium]
MLKTKAFAEICDTSKRTIIHYDRIGLLKPHRRRGIFRLYEPRQALTFQKVALLKSFGMSLREIKGYLRRNDLLLSLFEKKERQLTAEKNRLSLQIKKAQEFIASLKTDRLLISPKVKPVNPYWLYTLEKQGRYVDIASHQREIFQRVGDPAYHFPGITIFHNQKYSPHDSRMTTGVYLGDSEPPPIAGVRIVHVPTHQVLSYMHIGSYSYLSYIWQFMDQYIINYHLRRHSQLDCREIYWHGELTKADENDLVTELQIPILP